MGSLKMLMEKVEMVNAIALSKISLPPCDSTLPFHNYRRYHSLDLTAAKTLFHDLSIMGEGLDISQIGEIS